MSKRANPISIVLILFILFLSACQNKDKPLFNEDRVEEVNEQLKTLQEIASVFFIESQSPTDFMTHEDEIRAIRGVKDIYCDSFNVYIELDFGGSISYTYPLRQDDSFADLMAEISSLNVDTRVSSSEITSYPSNIEDLKICIVNQQSKDESRKSAVDYFECVKDLFESRGFNVAIENHPTVSFFRDELQEYDLSFLITHGSYDERRDVHWLLTSEKALFGDNDILHLALQAKGEVGIGHVIETRNGKEEDVAYYKINERFVSNQSERFNSSQSLLFNVSCESLKSNQNLAEAFREHGLGVYIGYDETNSTGTRCGVHYLVRLLSGFSYERAFSSLPQFFFAFGGETL